MSFAITITREFSASHQLRMYDGSIESLHGHNWLALITVSAAKLDSIGVVMDFHLLEELVDRIVRPMHNHHLNKLTEFANRNPSAENVALHIAESLKLPSHVRLETVEVRETDNCRAIWRAD